MDSVEIGGPPPSAFDPTSSTAKPDLAMSWTTVVEDGNAEEYARKVVLEQNQSLLVLGAAGCGKSTLVMKL